ncbi:MATE family efflux transporter [Clostridiaceae bacterium]|nr:MATE family efflux transporter [Clostridiaceae bacterium]RKI14138.1 MATE family efflux transporter [bacterium 1XD21-70]
MLFSRKDLIKLLGPLIVEQIMTVLVGMVDVVMVAAVGEAAVSGVALVDSVSILIIQLLAALSTGGAVVCSQYIGKQRLEDACHGAGQLILITVMCSVLFAGAALLGGRRLLELVFGQAEEAVMKNAAIYFRITALSYVFLALYNSGAALFRSMGNSRVSMMASLVMNWINIVGNAICIYGLHMGVEGVAWPTLFSRVVAAVLMGYLVTRPGNAIHVSGLKDLVPDKEMVKRIMRVGIPSGLENGMFQFGKIALQSLVSTLGTASIASFAVASNLVTFHYLPGNALGLGLITIVGQCVGAGEYEQAKQYTKKLILANYGFLFVICGVMVIFSHPIVGMYHLSLEASELARKMILMHTAGMLIWPLAFPLPNTLRAALDSRFTMAVSVFSMWVFRIGFAYLFVKVWKVGVMGVWWGMFIDWIFRAAVFVARFCGFSSRARQV